MGYSKDNVNEADYREPISHALDTIGVKASTASLAGQDAAQFSLAEAMNNLARSMRSMNEGVDWLEDAKYSYFPSSDSSYKAKVMKMMKDAIKKVDFDDHVEIIPADDRKYSGRNPGFRIRVETIKGNKVLILKWDALAGNSGVAKLKNLFDAIKGAGLKKFSELDDIVIYSSDWSDIQSIKEDNGKIRVFHKNDIRTPQKNGGNGKPESSGKDLFDESEDDTESRAEKNSIDAASSKSVKEADTSFEDINPEEKDDVEFKVTAQDIETSKKKFKSGLDKLSKVEIEKMFDEMADRISNSMKA